MECYNSSDFNYLPRKVEQSYLFWSIKRFHQNRSEKLNIYFRTDLENRTVLFGPGNVNRISYFDKAFTLKFDELKLGQSFISKLWILGADLTKPKLLHFYWLSESKTSIDINYGLSKHQCPCPRNGHDHGHGYRKSEMVVDKVFSRTPSTDIDMTFLKNVTRHGHAVKQVFTEVWYSLLKLFFFDVSYSSNDHVKKFPTLKLENICYVTS